MAKRHSNEEIKSVIEERFLEIKDRFSGITIENKILTNGIVEVSLYQRWGNDYYHGTPVMTETTKNKLKTEYSKPEVLYEILENFTFILNYFDFEKFEIINLAFSHNKAVRSSHGGFRCIVRFTKKKGTRKSLIKK
jgi:hypothetical protein